MVNSMTGFAIRQLQVPPFGKVSVELRSTNHKFLETVVHMPEGLLVLEDKVKGEVEAKMKRGRITCVVNLIGVTSREVFIDSALLRRYVAAVREAKRRYGLKGELSLDTLINLPGILTLSDSGLPNDKIWPRLRLAVRGAVGDLAAARRKEGQALGNFLKKRAQALAGSVRAVKASFHRAIKARAAQCATDEERASFLKSSDITEELDRLAFHINNFIGRLAQQGPMGKELDFITQEMQREANTMGAKSCDGGISARVVKIKSEIEKMREQLQNVE